MITYVHFYRYAGVATLFAAFGYDIGPTSDAYLGFVAQIQDRTLAARLSASVNPMRIASDADDSSERAA